VFAAILVGVAAGESWGESQGEGRARGGGFPGLGEQSRRDVWVGEQGIAPFIEVDHLGEQFGAQAVGAAVNGIYAQLRG
jgi:hypothetical protein